MSIIGEVRAAAALINWTDTLAEDMPWKFSKLPNGTPCFTFPGANPSRVVLVPRRRRWLLVAFPFDALSNPREFDVGAWDDQPGLIAHNFIVSLAGFASTYTGDGHVAGDFAMEALRMALAAQNAPATAYAAEILGDISFRLITVDVSHSLDAAEVAIRAYSTALGAVLRTDLANRERLENKRVLAASHAVGRMEAD